jgi:glycosyltransferase involved in cell wall biosynthesis
MKISIVIPQYNRIQYLLRSLEIISLQNYENIEVVISDDCSTDNTEFLINELIPEYKYPIIYHRNNTNMGYDYNYRNCISLASGDYSIVLGNDDSIYGANSIEYLVDFLSNNDFPDIGFCNMIEESTGGTFINRAPRTKIIGCGIDVSLQNYSCFSFVGGLIYKTDTFKKYNTAKYDGSIYSQMYLGVYMINCGAILFSIHEALVLKDLVLENEHRNSYLDTISIKWKDFKVVDGGLPSVINVLISSLKDSKLYTEKRAFLIFRRIYSITFPYWILDYRLNGALPEAVGLIIGLAPHKNKLFFQLSFLSKFRLIAIYLFASIFSLLTPIFLYKKIKQTVYSIIKR